MPIEIRELHIRVAVDTSPGAPPAAAQATGATRDDAKDAIVAECVEQVLRILQGKTER